MKSVTKTQEQQEEHQLRRVNKIMQSGGRNSLSRAFKVIGSRPRAPINEQTMTKLRALHPQAKSPMGSLPIHQAAELVTIEKVLDRAVKRCDNGSSPGVSGWTGAHLAAIMAGCTKEARRGFALFIRDVCNGVFTGELHRRLMACCLTPISKPDNVGIRPIAVMETFTKCAAHCAVLLIEDRIHLLFPTIQYGVKRSGGSETATHLIRNLLRRCSRNSPHLAAVLNMDFENAFNTVSRKRVWETLVSHAHITGPLLKAFYVQYSEPSPLLVYDGSTFIEELQSTEGVRQGDPFAGIAFSLAVQPLYVAAIAAMEKDAAGHGVAIQDDLAAIATWRETLKVFDYVREHAHAYGLKLRADKCQLYLPPETATGTGCDKRLEEIRAACNARHIPITFKLVSLGVMHGLEKDIEQHCADKVEASEKYFAALEHPVLSTQVAMLLLRYCGIPRLGYLTRTIHPNRLAAAAGCFDQRLTTCFQSITQMSEKEFTALDQEEIEHKEDDPPAKPSAVTRQQLMTRISLPVRMGGLGLRPVSRTMTPAYYSALVTALPELLRLCPEMQSTGDGPDSEGHSQQIVDTEIYAELSDLRQQLLDTGAFNRRQRRQLARDVTAAEALVMQPQTNAPPRSEAPVPLTAPEEVQTSLSLPITPPPCTTASEVPATTAAAAVATTTATTGVGANMHMNVNAPTTTPSSPSSTVLKKDTNELWSAATTYARGGISSLVCKFMPADKLQERITEAVESKLHEDMFVVLGPYQQTILTSLGASTHSGAFLSVLPTERAYRMKDDQMRLTLRSRLGMLPSLSLLHESCLNCHGRNTRTEPRFESDPRPFPRMYWKSTCGSLHHLTSPSHCR